MTDESAKDATGATQAPGERSNRAPDDQRNYAQRNLAGRLFPGPSKEMSQQFAEHVQELLKSPDRDAAIRALRERRGAGGGGAPRPPIGSGGRHADGTDHAGEVATTPSASQPEVAPASAPPAASSDDLAQLHESIDQQNDLLRAILQSNVDTQADARSTAQNSRTFAWAGTAIALLTLIATVIAIIAAINGG